MPLQDIIAANSGKPPAAAEASPEKSGSGQDPSKSAAAPLGELSEIQQVNSGMDEITSKHSVKYDAHFKPNHWADAQIFYGNAKTIDLEKLIQKKFDAVIEQARKDYLVK